MSPLSEVAYSLIERGLSIVPIAPGGKKPGALAGGQWRDLPWNTFKTRHPTEEELTTWSEWPGCGVAVITGHLSKIVALDLDDRPDLHSKILAVLPPSPVRKQGARGQTLFYRYSGEDYERWKDEEENTICELLVERVCVIPPTIHPSGRPYRWLTPETLLSLDPAELPALPEDLGERMAEALARTKPTTAQMRNGAPGDQDDWEAVKAALGHLPSSVGHEDWIAVGMAIHSAFPTPQGLQLFDDWSRSCAAKYKQGEPAKRWKSFNGSGGIHLGTLFHMAGQYGYRPEVEEVPGVDLTPFLNRNDDDEPDEPEDSLALPEQLLTSAPGLPGQIAAWINRSSLYYHPALALGAALAFVGVLKGHRVRNETNLRTNLQILGVAPSGSGKNHAMEMIDQLATEAGLDTLLGGRPASDSGLVRMLAGTPRKLILWDEVGLALKEMTSPTAGGHKAAILRVMMELFSKAGGTYRGYEYANHDGDRERRDVVQPCLGVYAASTPEKLFGAMNSSYVTDGFLPRWLVFESCRHTARRKVAPQAPPPFLIANVQDVDLMSTNVAPQGNVGRLTQIVPYTMPLSARAEQLLDDAVSDFDRRKSGARGDALQALWARAAEHVIKVALVVEEFDVVSEEAMRWSLELITRLLEATAGIVEKRVADSDYHIKLNWVLGIIRKAGRKGISQSELTKLTHRLSRSVRKDILETLIEGEQVECVDQRATRKPTRFYRVKPQSKQLGSTK